MTTDHLCHDIEAGGAAQLTVRLRNNHGQPQRVTAQVSGAGAQFVTPTIASASVPTFGHATFNFNVSVPRQTAAGTYADVRIVVQGRREHVLNWRVDVVEQCDAAATSKQEIVFRDGAAPVHRWYDRLYGRRPCQA